MYVSNLTYFRHHKKINSKYYSHAHVLDDAADRKFDDITIVIN